MTSDKFNSQMNWAAIKIVKGWLSILPYWEGGLSSSRVMPFLLILFAKVINRVLFLNVLLVHNSHNRLALIFTR
jgi:hypothetical protein